MGFRIQGSGFRKFRASGVKVLGFGGVWAGV